ncbi:MAG TPA: GNAT family N-acetyltransferase [bacterium]|nr:GNAT family N-acetyltransferase [bacterium]
MRVELRQALPDDAPVCHRLDHACFPPEVAYDEDGFVELCEMAPVYWIAEHRGRMVGFVAADLDQANNHALIITLDVDPDCRRRGIGSALMEKAESEIGKQGVRRIYLHLYIPHYAARCLYEQRGYRPVGVLPGYYGNEVDALLMVKQLQEDE